MESQMITNNNKMKMRLTTINEEEIGEDKISSLPDDLIYHIFSFSDTKLAVQTSVLSKRWKLVWTTLPFLKIYGKMQFNFAENFLFHRNHGHDLLKLYIFIFRDEPWCSYGKFINYAISHNVQDLEVVFDNFNAIKLSTFSSTSVKTLKLLLYMDGILESDCSWDLPALTTLHLMQLKRITLPKSYFNCLSSLETLFLHKIDLQDSATLLSLKTLHLTMCNLPAKAWDVPALLTLTLDDVEFPKENAGGFLRGLVNLQNLALSFETRIMNDWVIDCPQLVNLEIDEKFSIAATHHGKILVTSQKIRSFSSFGFLPVTFEVSELENVNIKLWDGIEYSNPEPKKKIKKYLGRVTNMFRRLCNTRILTLDLNTIQALSSILDFLVHSPPPFNHLKYVKVPQGYKESSMSPYLKCYLLGNSPKATIVTTLPQNMIRQTAVASVTDQNVVQQEPLAAANKVLADSVNKTVCVDTVDTEVQEEQVVQNNVVNADRVRQIDAPVAVTCNDRVSSCRRYCEFGLWHDHEVNYEFVYLLDLIMNKHPETFEHFTTKNKKLCTMKLNMLCTLVNDFTKICMTEVDTEMIAEYRDVFAGLQKFGFNVSWLVNRLKYVEHLQFSQPLLSELHAIDRRIVDAKHKVQDLETLRGEKMQEIQKAFGTMGTDLAIGYIGDDLLRGP